MTDTERVAHLEQVIANKHERIDALNARVKALEAFIEAHAFTTGQERCVSCYAWKRDAGDPVTHEAGCELVALLGREPKT